MSKESKSIYRINLSCTYAQASAFIESINQLQALVAQGLLSKDNVFVKWGDPNTKSKIESIVPGNALTEDELLGYDSYSKESAEKIKKALNKHCASGKYQNRQIVAAYVAQASVPDYNTFDIEIQENHKKAALTWVDANCCNKEDSTKIFVSRKGVNGGICLRVSQ